MNRALGLLVGLQIRSWFRYLGRSLRTVKGALLALVGALVFLPWAISLFLPISRESGSLEPETLRRTGPAFLVAYCLLNVLLSTSEKAIYFSPAEVNFLFSGPFSRRQLLAYKLMQTLLVALPSALLMSLFVRVRGAWGLANFVGLMQVFLFLQLFGITLSLLASSLGTKLYTLGRQIAVALAVLAGAIVLAQGGILRGLNVREVLENLSASSAWQTLSLPLRWFIETILAREFWPDLLLYATLSTLVNLGLVLLIFAVDAHYLEASSAHSARLYARLQRARGRIVSDNEARTRKPPRFTLPMLPYLGGVGPIVWRQALSAARGMGRLALVLLVFGAILGVPIVSGVVEVARNGTAETGELTREEGEMFLVGSLAGVGAWLTIFFTTLVPYDFRGDVDRLAAIKTLPIAPWRIALAELVVPTLVLALVQAVGLTGLLIAFPGQREVVLGCLAVAAPLDFLLIGLENLLFLLFPVRLMAATPGDFQALGRNVLLVLARMLGVGLVGGFAGLLGVLVALLTGSTWAGMAAAVPVVAAAGLALVPFVSMAFQAFDVSRDTPA